MAAASLTFEQIESSTGKTYAFAVFAEHAKTGISVALGTIVIVYLARRLKVLISKAFSRQSLEGLTEEQITELMPLLQDLHSQLVRICKSCPREVERVPLLAGAAESIKESTEELNEILEDLALMHDKEFKALISQSIGEVRKNTHLEAMHH